MSKYSKLHAEWENAPWHIDMVANQDAYHARLCSLGEGGVALSERLKSEGKMLWGKLEPPEKEAAWHKTLEENNGEA
jgi:hypothetical protein